MIVERTNIPGSRFSYRRLTVQDKRILVLLGRALLPPIFSLPDEHKSNKISRAEVYEGVSLGMSAKILGRVGANRSDSLKSSKIS